MNKLKILIDFVKNNKLLTSLFVVAFILITIVFFTKVNIEKTINTDNTIKIEFQTLKSSKIMDYYVFEDKYYVFIKDYIERNENTVRSELGIPENIEFTILYPEAFKAD